MMLNSTRARERERKGEGGRDGEKESTWHYHCKIDFEGLRKSALSPPYGMARDVAGRAEAGKGSCRE